MVILVNYGGELSFAALTRTRAGKHRISVQAARQLITKGGTAQFTQLLTDIRSEEYGFEGGPYLGFPSSHDVYGDGSIVVVPAPGHTPGSAIIFVTLHNGTRYAFVGDLVWQVEGITLREERSWLVRQFAELDEEGTRENL